MRRLLAALVPLLAAGCTYFHGSPYVIVTSDPAGAEVLVDGASSGQTTPAKLDLGGIIGTDHLITLRKRGFVDEHRRVYHYTTGYTSRLIDAATEVELLNNPTYWTVGDLFLPFGVEYQYVPHELYVTLYGEGLGPVQAVPGVTR